jgi:hypothetical protein
MPAAGGWNVADVCSNPIRHPRGYVIAGLFELGCSVVCTCEHFCSAHPGVRKGENHQWSTACIVEGCGCEHFREATRMCPRCKRQRVVRHGDGQCERCARDPWGLEGDFKFEVFPPPPNTRHVALIPRTFGKTAAAAKASVEYAAYSNAVRIPKTTVLVAGEGPGCLETVRTLQARMAADVDVIVLRDIERNAKVRGLFDPLPLEPFKHAGPELEFRNFTIAAPLLSGSYLMPIVDDGGMFGAQRMATKYWSRRATYWRRKWRQS